MVQNKAQLIHLLLENQEHIKAFGVHQLGLFGSFVRDEATPSSDVDFLVDFEEGKKKFNNLFYLSEYLTTLTGRKVEVLTREGLSPYIGPEILKTTQYVPFC